MSQSQIPASPWANPLIVPGIYLATITEVSSQPYGLNSGKYVRMVFWLPSVGKHLVSNLYFPNSQPDARTVKRLGGLCQQLGLAPQDIWESPKDFINRDVGIRVTKCVGVGVNAGTEYRDVGTFLSPDLVTKDGKVVV